VVPVGRQPASRSVSQSVSRPLFQVGAGETHTGAPGDPWCPRLAPVLLSVIQVGLQLVDLSAYDVQMIGGAMILIAIAVDTVRVRRAPPRARAQARPARW
jgi:hypothetical protein